MGYSRAGFDVYGIDNKAQRHYPFPFLQMDAFKAMDGLLRGEGLTFSNDKTLYLSDFSAYHASPPCQGYTPSTNIKGDPDNYDRLIPYIRPLLVQTNRPYVIENVPTARADMISPLLLCGTMFGLRVKRHRLFEFNFDCLLAPATCSCHGKDGRTYAFRSSSRFSKSRLITVAGHNFAVAEARIAMGIDWMTSNEIREAIPPAYTEYIGRHLIAVVSDAAEVSKYAGK